MRQRRKKILKETPSEFELDLAPLLSVMVKLVPVLLLSSAFVQMVVLETELPQIVQEQIQKQEKIPDLPLIALEANKEGFTIRYSSSEKTENFEIKSEGTKLPFTELHKQLVTLKKRDPRVFKIELNPSETLPYEDIIHIMDEARNSKDPQVRFPIETSMDNSSAKDNTAKDTEYMFPEIVFGNALEGT